MGKTLAVSLALFLVAFAAPLSAQGDEGYEPFSPDQLDNLLAPIALYPDPLLAQVLIAATFPDEIDDASRFVRNDSDADNVDRQWWDVSVKAVAHYPEVLDMMADKLDWTTALGQAYVNQSTDVMASVQRLRSQARSAGNLVTTPEMEVVDSGSGIELWPAQPEYIFVPQYDPAVIFFVRAPLFFRARFFIGAWLNIDFDWRFHRLFYHGWEHGRGWMERSRPYVHLNDVYVHDNFRNVTVNRNVIRQRVNYRTLDRYDDVHHDANFDRFRGTNRVITLPPPVHETVPYTVHNKVIVRNIDTTDPRLNEFRGHFPKATSQVHLPDPSAFTAGHEGFDAHEASHRGQLSRSQVKVPPPPPPPPHPAVRKVERKHP